MHADLLRSVLDSPQAARPLLAGWGLRDLDRAGRNLAAVARHLGPDPAHLGGPLARLLPRTPDPDMALNNLERFLANPAAVPLLPAILENRARALEILLQLFGTSQMFSDLLARHPDAIDLLRVPLRKSPS